MQVTETVNEGLKREIKVVVPKDDMSAKLDERLQDLRGKARINGFRPGKVPISHLKKLYGKSAMAEIVQETIDTQAQSVLAERGEKAAQRPSVEMTEDEALAERVLQGAEDFEFTIQYEVIPDFEVVDTADIAIERPVVEVSDDEVAEQVDRIAESARTYAPRDGAAELKDRVTFDYEGKIDGEPFEGGKDEGAKLVLGSNTFIPGFEDQLVGLAKGDAKTVTVTFPEDYGAAELAGKEATFDVTVHEVEAPAEQEVDDELAKKLGVESVERLREIVRDQIGSQYSNQTRQKTKRQLLDALDERYSFELPQKMVDQEFQNIWTQITNDLEQAGRSFEDEDTTEEKAREEYRRLAERRVRLGLVLSEIGEKAGITVSEEELQRAVYDQVRQYPGQEQQIYDFFRSNPDAVGSLRAPIFEEKVVDHLLEQVTVTDKTVSKEELMADDELPA